MLRSQLLMFQQIKKWPKTKKLSRKQLCTTKTNYKLPEKRIIIHSFALIKGLLAVHTRFSSEILPFFNHKTLSDNCVYSVRGNTNYFSILFTVWKHKLNLMKTLVGLLKLIHSYSVVLNGCWLNLVGQH